MRVHIIQHVPFEGPGAILEWSAERGYRQSYTRVFTGEPFPAPDEVDLLVVMGGPMSVNDVDDLPWLAEEKRTISEFVKAEKRVLGICLGAQLIADALGERVYRSPEKEIGWFPVTLTAEGKQSPLFKGFPETFVPLHWHGETFSLPSNAVLIASSAAVPNQAFTVGERVVGLQFHLEATATSLAELVECASSDITGGKWQQSADQIRQLGDSSAALTRGQLFMLLDQLTASQ